MPSNVNLMWQMLFQFFIVVVLVFAGVGFAAGIGLIISSARTLRFFQVMNRWISTRGALRPMEIPRNTDQFSHWRPESTPPQSARHWPEETWLGWSPSRPGP